MLREENKIIRKNYKVEELLAEPNNVREIKAHWLRWLRHVESMEANRAVKRAYISLEGHGSQGSIWAAGAKDKEQWRHLDPNKMKYHADCANWVVKCIMYSFTAGQVVGIYLQLF